MLIETFVSALNVGLTEDEAETVGPIEFPRLRRETDKDGCQLVVLEWSSGRRMAFEFDGTFEDAMETVRVMAAVTVSDLSEDHWLKMRHYGPDSGGSRP
jgi:hypothetical protein